MADVYDANYYDNATYNGSTWSPTVYNTFISPSMDPTQLQRECNLACYFDDGTCDAFIADYPNCILMGQHINTGVVTTNDTKMAYFNIRNAIASVFIFLVIVKTEEHTHLLLNV